MNIDWLRHTVENNETKAGRAFDMAIQVLIVISLLAFAIETLPNLMARTLFGLHIIEVVTVVVFSMEYALRFVISKPRSNFVFSFFGLVDLLSILPFYLASGVDLRSECVELFEDQWPRVQGVLEELKRFGIYCADPKPANIHL